MKLVSVFLIGALLLCACGRRAAERRDSPLLTPNVALHDITFRSDALARGMTYRVILPVLLASGKRRPVIYLLHGGGGDYRDWSNYYDVAKVAEQGFVLVGPR